MEETKLFKVTVSFGNVVSQISLPCFMSHASIPAATRAARGLPDDLVRISVGIEDARDLLKGSSASETYGCSCNNSIVKAHLFGLHGFLTQEELLIESFVSNLKY